MTSTARFTATETMRMNRKDRERLQDAIDCEGFDYAFEHYSSFDEVEDDHFHGLRKRYLEARKELAVYVGVE